MAGTSTSAQTQNQAPRPRPEAEEIYRRWVRFLDEEFTKHRSPQRRSEIVRDQLYQVYLGRPYEGRRAVTLSTELPGDVLSLSLDPENVTLEAEHYGEVDQELFAVRKPLLWFWQMFDRSPIGLNLWLGVRVRCMLGRHIFKYMGAGVKIHPGVDLTYGYNLSVGDGAIIRKGAMLNDRGGITIGRGALIGSFSRVFSHSYAQGDFDHVTLHPTTIGDRARVASHAIVLAGQDVPPDGVVGTFPADRI
ncbi:MAG: acyltransferase [Terracidiphilus sp.]